MTDAGTFDKLFQQAVSAIDNGDEVTLKQLLDAHGELATERLKRHHLEWHTPWLGRIWKSNRNS